MEKWTHKGIVDAIINDVTDGLHGSPHTPIPKEQLSSEVILYRNAFLEDLSIKTTACQESKDAVQQINCIPVGDNELSNCCEPTFDELMYCATIPKLLNMKGGPAISYIGLPNRRGLSWKVYDDESYNLRGYKVGVRNRPYVALTPASDGQHKVYIFNPPPMLDTISVTGIFADPYAKYEYACCKITGDPEELVEFPAPDAVIQRILETLTQKYITYYRQGNAPIQNNDQTDKVT